MPDEKLNLSSNREVPLSLYTYITRPGENAVVSIPQNISLLVAYSHEEAFEQLRKQWPNGQPFTCDFKGSIPMAVVLNMFSKTVNIDTVKPEPDIIARTKRDFYREIVEGMIKDAGAFATTEQEKNTLLVALHKMLSIVQ